jgi:hypothetical protein
MKAAPTPAGIVLFALASQLFDLMCAVENAIGNDDVQALPPILAALRNAGLLADEAGHALGETRVSDLAGWLYSPRVDEAMAELKRGQR